MPDLLLDCTYTCDQSPKASELIHELYGVPVVYVDTVADQDWGEYPDLDERRVAYLGARIDQAMRQVEQILDIRITEDIVHSTTRENARLWGNYQALMDFVAASDPQPLSQVDLGLICNIAVGHPTRRLDELNECMVSLHREAEIPEDGQGQPRDIPDKEGMPGHHGSPEVA